VDITQLEGFQDLKDLQSLNFRDNNIRDLSTFHKLKNLSELKTLDLSFIGMYNCSDWEF